MPLDFDFEVAGELLIVTTTGYDEDVNTAVSYGEAVIRNCVENQCWKIFADESELTGVLDKISQYEMVQRLVSQVPYNLYIAIIVNPAFYEESSFGALVAENRGVHIKIFTEKDPAHQWLQQQKKEVPGSVNY